MKAPPGLIGRRRGDGGAHRRVRLFASRSDFRHRDCLAVLIEITGELDVRTGVCCERAKVLVLDVVKLVAAHEDVLGARFNTTGSAVLRILAYLAHRGVT